MKHAFTKLLNLLLFVSLLAAGARAQELQPVLSMSPNPSPYLSDWQSRRETVTLLATLDRPYNEPVKLMAQVSLNGNIVAITKAESMPTLTLHTGLNQFNAEQIIPYAAVSFTGTIDKSAQRLGRLPEGRYDFCAWFINASTGQPISAEQCQSFMIVDINPPELIAPANEEATNYPSTTDLTVSTGNQYTLDGLAKQELRAFPEFGRIDIVCGTAHTLYTIDPKHTERDTAEALQIPIMTLRRDSPKQLDVSSGGMQFQWLPPMPSPAGQVEYRLRIVEVLPGQTAQQAITTGSAIVDRDKITTTNTTQPVPMEEISMNYTRKTFAWAVQAHDIRGMAIGRNNGWSQPHVFHVGDPDFDLLRISGQDSPKTKPVVLESFFDVFQTVDMPLTGVRFNNGPKQEPCPYQYKVRKGMIYVRGNDGQCKIYAVFDVFTCTLLKGHAGPHHGAMTTVYVLTGTGSCPEGKGDTAPPKDKIIDRKELDKIPFKEEADKADVGVKAVGKVPCPYVEKTLLRTVVGPWRKISTNVRHIAWRKTVVAWADVTWKRDVFNVFSVAKCTLEKGHAGAHKLGAAVEVKELYGTFTETVTYGPGQPQVPPKPHATDGVPEE